MKDSESHMDFESVLNDIYGNGFYHIILLLLCSMTSFVVGFEVQTIIFMHYTPLFECSDPILSNASSVIWTNGAEFTGYSSNQSFVFNSHNATIEQCVGLMRPSDSDHYIPFKCSQWDYEQSVMGRTVVTQFDLVCGNRFWIPWMESAYMAFSAVGYVLAFLSDSIGRRIPFLAFTVWGAVISFATPFSPSVEVLLALRCCRGMSIALSYIGMNLISELVPMQHRAAYGNVYWILWAFGYMACSGLAYSVRDWIALRLWSCLFLASYLFCPFLIWESPRFLCMKGKTGEAMRILRRIARWNRSELPADYFERAHAILISERAQHLRKLSGIPLNQLTSTSSNGMIQTGIESIHPSETQTRRNDSILDMFRFPNLRKHTLVLCFIHSAITTIYFGLITDNKFAMNDIFLNVLLLGLMEIPTSFVGWGVSVYLGRRFSTALLLILTGLAVMVAKVSDGLVPILSVLSALFAKFFLAVSYCVSDLYITELYPTTIRSTGFFTVITVAGIISAVAPFVNVTGQLYHMLPSIIYSSAALLGALLIHIYLPETKDCPLPQTVEEAESLVRGKEKEWSEHLRLRKSRVARGSIVAIHQKEAIKT